MSCDSLRFSGSVSAQSSRPLAEDALLLVIGSLWLACHRKFIG